MYTHTHTHTHTERHTASIERGEQDIWEVIFVATLIDCRARDYQGMGGLSEHALDHRLDLLSWVLPPSSKRERGVERGKPERRRGVYETEVSCFVFKEGCCSHGDGSVIAFVLRYRKWFFMWVIIRGTISFLYPSFSRAISHCNLCSRCTSELMGCRW